MLEMKSIHFLLLGLVLFVVSCSQSNTCLSPKVVSLRTGFYYQNTDSTRKDTILNSAKFIVGTDTTFYQLILNSRNSFAVTLPQTSDSFAMYFAIDTLSAPPGSIDTMQLYFSRKLHFISTACGYETYYNITNLTFTKHLLDSVILNNASVNNDVNLQHLQFVLKN